MRRWLAAWLCLCFLIGTTACGTEKQQEEADKTAMDFYFCAIEDAYPLTNGALAWETRDVSVNLTAEELLSQYLRGPEHEWLRTPLPKDTTAQITELQNGILTIDLGGGFDQLSGIDLTVAAASLVCTMVQLKTVDSVVLTRNGKAMAGSLGGILSSADFVLLDDAATSNRATVKLYFADKSARYLVEESRSDIFENLDILPYYIIGQLLQGPLEQAGAPTLPEGTRLLSLRITEGTCTVNFSEEFILNAPGTHSLSRMAIFSVVNSLTEIPQIEAVRILCDGSPISQYGALDLSEPLYREEPAFGVLPGRSSYDATLYLPTNGSNALAAVPLQIRRSTTRSLAEDVLNSLLTFEAANGYENVIPDGTIVEEIRSVSGTCYVVFNSAFAACDAIPSQAEEAVRSVVATLCGLSGVDRVQIQISGGQLRSVDISAPLEADESWIVP